MNDNLTQANSFADGTWAPSEEDKEIDGLPEPEYLKTSLLVEFVHGNVKFELLCIACSIRNLKCSETGRTLDWVHCKAFFSADYKEGESIPTKTLLFPLEYVTRSCPGPVFSIENRKPTIETGVFPARHAAPVERVPSFEFYRSLTRSRGLVVPEPVSGRMYNDFIGNVSQDFESEIERIRVRFNFDYGDEFEVAVIKVLQNILPQRFGVCRGFVVNARGDAQGDDIIIFDRMRFPTIRSLDPRDLSRKDEIPIEAVYAYIEVKHTLDIHGDSGTSLLKAVRQVSHVKLLCKQRMDVGLGEVKREGWPPTRNPVYGAIIARQVRSKPNAPVLSDPALIQSELCNAAIKCELPPDLIVAGRDNISIPAIRNEEGYGSYTPSPFHLHPQPTSHVCPVAVNGIAFGAGFGFLLWALDWIRLGEMPWPEILMNALPKPTDNQSP